VAGTTVRVVLALTTEGGNRNQEWFDSCGKVAGERKSSSESREKMQSQPSRK